MTHATLGHRAAKRGRDVILNQEIGETLGTVFAGESDQGRADGVDGVDGRTEGVRRTVPTVRPSSPSNRRSAPGSPKLYRTSLSAATGKVLTRFARRYPPDLGRRESSSGEVPHQWVSGKW